MFPLGPFFSRNITLKTDQAHARSYMERIYNQIVRGDIDPTEIITHHMMRNDASEGYKMFNGKEDDCIKVVLRELG